MGYKVSKSYLKKDGTWSWRVHWRSAKKGEKCERHVSETEYLNIGLSENMTLEEAKERVKQINAQAWLKNKEERRNKIQARLQKEDKEACAYLPDLFAQNFEKELQKKYLDNPGQLKRVTIHWHSVKRIIRQVNLPPEEWHENTEVFYNYLKTNKVSWEYSKKLLRILNMWGYYISKNTSKTFHPVPMPTGYHRERIVDAHFDAGKSKESLPLTPERLESKRTALTNDGKRLDLYNWLFLSVWLGLRPSEIDGLKNPITWKTEEEDGTIILHVYQNKLRNVPRAKRWKLIPLFLPEQLKCLEIIKSGDYKRPLMKTMENHFGERYTTYAGRKGFTDLMLSKGQDLVNISSWMGHLTIERTWRSYKDKMRVHFKKAG